MRFTRDKRGYETTSLVHSYRGRHGRARQKLLYWFRTPPNVKVGRPALDEEAIRWIEEHNPDIEFDWQKILEATPTPAPPVEEGKGRRGRQRKGERQDRSRQPRASGVQRQVAPPATISVSEEPASAIEPGVDEEPLGDLEESEAIEQLTHPDAEEEQPPPRVAVETALTREQSVRLRARYAELQARIIERGGGDAARIETLRAQAEPLNPDTWVTVEEVRAGLAGFEARIRELRAALGLKRRRRSRRGGRRHRSTRRGSEASLTASRATDAGSEASLAASRSAEPGSSLEAAPAAQPKFDRDDEALNAESRSDSPNPKPEDSEPA